MEFFFFSFFGNGVSEGNDVGVCFLEEKESKGTGLRATLRGTVFI